MLHGVAAQHSQIAAHAKERIDRFVEATLLIGEHIVVRVSTTVVCTLSNVKYKVAGTAA